MTNHEATRGSVQHGAAAPIDAPDLAMAGASAALLAVEPGPWSASAPCKRALRGASCGAMKEMFGKDQLSAMADLVQGSLMSLMLRYNKRCVG